MKISKIQEHLQGDYLHDPEKALGENYKSVLNFWLLVDTLSEEQWKQLNHSYRSYSNDEEDLLIQKVKDVIEEAEFPLWNRIVDYLHETYGTQDCWIFTIAWATHELIAMNSLNDEGFDFMSIKCVAKLYE